MRIPFEYDSFEDPHAGLAAMILYQAWADVDTLSRKGVPYVKDSNAWDFGMEEILDFLGTKWAANLAEMVNFDITTVWAWAEQVAEYYKKSKKMRR